MQSVELLTYHVHPPPSLHGSGSYKPLAPPVQPLYVAFVHAFRELCRISRLLCCFNSIEPEISEIRSTTIGETRYSDIDNGESPGIGLNRDINPVIGLAAAEIRSDRDFGASNVSPVDSSGNACVICDINVLNSEASLDDGAVTGPSTSSSLPVPNRPDGEIPFSETAQVLNSEASLDDGAITGPYTGSSLPVPNRPDGEIPFCERAQVLNSEASLDDGAFTGPYTGSSLPVPNRPDGEIPFCERAQIPSQPPRMLDPRMHDLQIFGIRLREYNVAAEEQIISTIEVRLYVAHPISINDINDVFGVQLREVDDTTVGLVAASIDVRINDATDAEPAYEDNDIN